AMLLLCWAADFVATYKAPPTLTAFLVAIDLKITAVGNGAAGMSAGRGSRGDKKGGKLL
ncbi:hypothetical protein SK128_022390, partial [Halocaridina rubra]